MKQTQKLKITKDYLIKEYSKNEKSTYKIAKDFGCAANSILYWLVKYKIPRRTNSESKKQEKHPFYGKKRPEHSIWMKNNNPMKGKKRPDLSKRNKLMSGKNSFRFGKPPAHSKGDYYKGTWMRSFWEIAFAYFLDLSRYKYLYESKTFNLGNTTYTPDFYIPEWDLYIEIKGYWRKDAKKKFKLFKKLYPKVGIKVIMQEELQELGVL